MGYEAGVSHSSTKATEELISNTLQAGESVQYTMRIPKGLILVIEKAADTE